MSNPYITNSGSFTRFDGTIKFDGKIFRFVKRAVVDGNLVLLCVLDGQQMTIEKSRSQYMRLAGDFDQNDNKKKDTESKAGLVKEGKTKHKVTNILVFQPLAGEPSVVYNSFNVFLPPLPHYDIDHPPRQGNTLV